MQQFEKSLLVTTILVVTVDIIMALLIGLVLPNHWTKDNFVCSCGRDNSELSRLCRCQNKIIQYVEKSKKFLNETTSNFEGRNIENYPYLVSLSVPAYIDDNNEKRFLCNGVIVSNIWVLTGSICINQTNNGDVIQIRAGSNYWSKDGSLYNVSKIQIGPNGLAVIAVTPNFKFNQQIQKIALPSESLQSVSLFINPGWKFSYSNPLKYRKRYEKFAVDTWSDACNSHKCEKGLITNKETCEDILDGIPLIVGCNILIAFKCKNNQYHSRTFISLEKFHNWIVTLLNEPTNTENVFSKLHNLNIYKVNDCIKKDFNACFKN